jgi:hypothetical protein
MVFPGDRDRADEISTLLQGNLQEGEGFLVRCNNFSIEVVPFNESEPFELKHTHEELYGCLLSINEDMTERRFPYFWVLLMMVVFVCLGIHLQWFDGYTGVGLESVRSVWFYISIILASVVIYGVVKSFIERAVYKSRRPELLQAIFEGGITRYRLLARMEGDPGISSIGDKLKIDRSSGKVPQ